MTSLQGKTIYSKIFEKHKLFLIELDLRNYQKDTVFVWVSNEDG